MPLGMEVGLGSSHTVLDGDAPKGHSPSSNFRPMSVVAEHLAGWINLALRREVDLGQGDIVLDWDLAPPRKGHSSPLFFGPCLL